MDIKEILDIAVAQEASDIFLVAGTPITYKVHGSLQYYGGEKLWPDDTLQIVKSMYTLAHNREMSLLDKQGEDDFSFSLPGVARFRANAYHQRGSVAAIIRIVPFELPNPDKLMIPSLIMDYASCKRGLVLVTGPAGSGKSTTLACIIDQINRTRDCHIITIEDPIEFLHSHNRSIVSQREIMTDTGSYVNALRASLRQSPDVILLGEMRDYETIDVAMTAAETGHLVFSTLHTVGAANTIDRIIDVFPPTQQHQVRTQLAMVLQCVISQQLIPTQDNQVVPAFEVMTATSAVKNLIRESKIHQIDSVIFSSSQDGMLSMDTSILKLYREGRISMENALMYSRAPDLMEKKLRTR